jgi:type I restriction enzyme, S subunit
MNIPKGWEEVRIADIAAEIRDSVRPVAGKRYELWSVPSYATGEPEILDGSEIGSAKLQVQPWDVLVCKINPRINRVWVVTENALGLPQIASPEWLVLRLHGPASSVTAPFLAGYLSGPDFRRWISNAVSGVTGSHTRARSKEILQQRVPLAPLGEQQRIVTALNDYHARIDSAENSVRIATIRSRCLLDVLCSQLINRGKWERRPLEYVLAQPLINGRSVPTRDDGFPVLRLTAIKSGVLDLSERKGGDWVAQEASPFLVRFNDYFVARGNGSLKLVGRGALVREQPDPVAFPDTFIRVVVDRKKINPEFLRIIWDSREVRRQIESSARTTAGIYKINQRILQGITIPCPSLEEQEKMVAEFSSAAELIHRSEIIANLIQTQVDDLRSAVLRNAYSENSGSADSGR